ncbi:AbiV family abortive infection protein [Curtobacterium sp. PhB136]|uniref:AbiV family abortive infection protein n=1 Tax=Curtobacterium sp. PhB136 TaxID=2485181 RepID=UPI0010E7E38B|nr:AbiV family abortive infection protein [Curtobacterium sp. PhB136]TCK63789.1 AbiV family abortive infection protein [Curtobacterium sp. PhB136]
MKLGLSQRTPPQVIALGDALLANADKLLSSSIRLLDGGDVGLARSIAILAIEESGKAIALHERRLQMVWEPEGAQFRCEWLDALWASHTKKLGQVHQFLEEEKYWFDEQPSEPERNLALLGTLRAWSKRHDKQKQRGFYVDLDRLGNPMSPADVRDEEHLRDLIAYVHQIGWQLRLGEHIEGKAQAEQERAVPPADQSELDWLARTSLDDEVVAKIRASLLTGKSAKALPNRAYSFILDPEAHPLRNVGRAGYEAEDRELQRLAREIGLKPLSD